MLMPVVSFIFVLSSIPNGLIRLWAPEDTHTVPGCVHLGTRARIGQYFQVTNKKWEIKFHSEGSLST